MIFTSLTFYLFFGTVFLLYYTVFRNHQWELLLAASLFFYGFSSPIYLLYLMSTVLFSYLIARGIEKSDEKRAKMLLILLLVGLLGLLFVCKYLPFFCSLLPWSGFFQGVRGLQIILPIGLSFYIFQTIGYCVDVYRKSVAAEKNVFRHALYISFFPHVLQGPLGDYAELSTQLFQRHTFQENNAVYGLRRIAWGLFKKLVISNQISVIIDPIWENVDGNHGMVLILALLLYAIQLYADFSGYMDIALGCARMLGITLEENFDLPYFSRNIPEYWRRWHITLGKWFRTYVYYPILRSPLGSNFRKRFRKTHPYASATFPTVIALFITWFLIGLWHGANWGYIAHGLFHGFFVIMSVILAPFYKNFHKKHPRLSERKCYQRFQIIRTFLIVLIGYSLFRPANLTVTVLFYRNLVPFDLSSMAMLIVNSYRPLTIALAGLLILWFTDRRQLKTGIPIYERKITSHRGFQYLLYALFLCSIIIFGEYNQNSVNQFAYFAF